MSYFDRVAACNRYNIKALRPFVVGDKAYGWVRDDIATQLKTGCDVLEVSDKAVTFAAGLDTLAARTEAMMQVEETFVERGLVPKLRREAYAARETFHEQPAFLIDRALVAFFGIRAYGVHLNGFVRSGNAISLWTGLRSGDRAVEPGKLDNIVAGGQPAGLSLMDNLIKESAEEANLEAGLASTAKPVGEISYCFDNHQGLKRDTLFCFDLELPPAVTPSNQDGEIESFSLMSLDEALARIRDTDDYKFNVGLVILHFAIRHGVLNPDNEADFEAIIAGLHARGPVFHP